MSERLLGKEMVVIRSAPTGKMFVNGISSSYEETYDRDLSAILSREEHSEIMKRLNNTLTSHWPCTTVYFTACLLVPCTLGLSLLCPMMCVSEAEKHAVRMLDNLSLKAKYFDQNITFKLEKGCMTSQFVISFPANLRTEDSNLSPIENGEWGIQEEPSAESFKKGK
jgi:hypothetical protein